MFCKLQCLINQGYCNMELTPFVVKQYASGDMSSILVWDLDKEQVNTIQSTADSGISALVSSLLLCVLFECEKFKIMILASFFSLHLRFDVANSLLVFLMHLLGYLTCVHLIGK